jgi:hypothetical protein
MSAIIKNLLFIILFSFSLAHAQEVITGFEDKDLPVLNEQLRSTNDKVMKLVQESATEHKYIYFVLSDDVLTTGADKIGRIYMDFAGTILEAHASVKTAPTGADILVDLNLNGTTIWSTQGNRVTIAAAANTGTQTSFNTDTFASGDYFTIDLDQVGSGTKGARLVVRLKVMKS